MESAVSQINLISVLNFYEEWIYFSKTNPAPPVATARLEWQRGEGALRQKLA
jgi:hypothetical protein